MQTVTTSRTSTIAALYRDSGAAERTAARLESVGIPSSAITLRSEEREADISDLQLPEHDRARFSAGIQRGCTVLLVADIVSGSETSVIGILDREAIDIDAEPQGAEPVRDTVGQYGGAGSATGAFDRLTGERIGGERQDTDATAIPTQPRSRVYPK